MRLGVMQPYFLPYLGYFSLIKQTDRFILLDPVQFINKGWIKRNRILKPNGGWQYIAVPLMKHRRETKINEIRINNSSDWRETIFRQLEHYKKRSPFYTETICVLRNAFEIDTDNIVQLNEHILKTICDYLHVSTNMEILSEMDLNLAGVSAPDEWSLNICKALGNISEYWNPEGGVELYDRRKYHNAGLEINFLKINLPSYPQMGQAFEAGLSIVDVMMFNESNKINKMLDDYVVL